MHIEPTDTLPFARARSLLPLAVVALLGCGGSSVAASATRTSTSAGGDENERPSPTHVATSTVTTAEPMIPGGRVAIPGTGISMRLPRGAEPTEIGAGFVNEHDRYLIRVAVANGSSETLDQLVRSMRSDAEEVSTETITVQNRPARIVVDRQRHANLDLERVWVFVREGNQALVAVGAYAVGSPDDTRETVRTTILSTEWSPSTPVDPEVAAGFRLTAPEGLAPDPQIANTLTYLAPGTELSPATGRPAMLVVPLPFDVPVAERVEFCTRILPEAGPVGEDTVLARGEISTPTLQGCEVFGRESIPEPLTGGPNELATYAAIVFADDTSFMVVGSVDAADRDAWAPKFSEATRTVSLVHH